MMSAVQCSCGVGSGQERTLVSFEHAPCRHPHLLPALCGLLLQGGSVPVEDEHEVHTLLNNGKDFVEDAIHAQRDVLWTGEIVGN